jgi:predicted MFS family arabinose efflux permease
MSAPLDGDRPAVAGRPMSRRLVLLLAIACGAAVANLYYVQPLLNVVGDAFGVSNARAGLLVTCAQAGYLIGLAFLGPLGDLVERRRLVTVLLLCAAGVAAACAAAPSANVLGVALVAVGATSVVAMILIPLAATLAGPERRGQVVGTVMSGLLVGILLSRTLSGLVAELGGWRLVFALAAVGMLVLAYALRRGLPLVAPTERLRYPELLRSVRSLVTSEPVLRQRMALGALAFGGFAVLWTSIAFMLAKPPYGFGEGVIGLFGLAGLAGAVAAPVVGRLADRGRDRASLIVLLVATLASWGLLALGSSSLVCLIVGLVVFDAGIQGSHINNQDAIYRLRPEARSRMTTAYMVSFFAGGVLGSTLSATVYAAAGWDAACALGAGFALVALVVARRARGASSEPARAPRPRAGEVASTP